MKIGNAPASWGIEFADDERNPTWTQVLDECAAAGYAGIELGPIGYMPDDPAVLGDALAQRDLSLIGGNVFQPIHDPRTWDDVLAAARRTCTILAAHGARQFIIMDSISPKRVDTLGRADDAPQMTAQEWSAFVERIETIARMASEEFGLVPSIHAHAGGYCDFEHELDRIVDAIDETILKVCIDTAHATLAGMDPMAVTRRYATRISHVHLKDVDPHMKQRVIDEQIEFYTACALNLFCQIGDGEVEFAAFRKLLEDNAYDGWCVVEQDCAPDAKITKVEQAKANRKALEDAGYH